MLPCRQRSTVNATSVHPSLEFLISTASVLSVPRERARRPSRDQSNQKIRSDVKCVAGCGGPPAIGWSQMLPTPFTVLMKEMARPSGLQAN
jgi:hypothetical protein